ncbi:hypothetical protein HBN76_20810 [Pseudomonas sp. WS 5013]|uniref:hypothetical protein n=1 Tax=Pseudomonas sp. WS 5013 TaxID=2717475 RepID=UPI0014738FC0|nr:hypothetical protein [Pseudomonas sp. WS 5013]NMY43754.1 hypothetical protein [Pseudomonas sp. WS 5013]
MATSNVTGGTHRELTKYRLTFAAAVIGLAGAAWLMNTAYQEHVRVLRIGDETGQRLQMRGLAGHQEGAQHEQR